MTLKRTPRPRDPVQLGKLMVDIMTGQVPDAADDGKDAAKAEAGRRGAEARVAVTPRGCKPKPPKILPITNFPDFDGWRDCQVGLEGPSGLCCLGWVSPILRISTQIRKVHCTAARFLWRCDNPPYLEMPAGIFGGLGLHPLRVNPAPALWRHLGTPGAPGGAEEGAARPAAGAGGRAGWRRMGACPEAARRDPLPSISSGNCVSRR